MLIVGIVDLNCSRTYLVHFFVYNCLKYIKKFCNECKVAIYI